MLMLYTELFGLSRHYIGPRSISEDFDKRGKLTCRMWILDKLRGKMSRLCICEQGWGLNSWMSIFENNEN